ncbi:MAG: glycosyltransferase [Actinomycetes bacterium]
MLRQTVAVVIPVYRAGVGLEETAGELAQLTEWKIGPDFVLELTEIVMVCDRPGALVNPAAFQSRLLAIDDRITVVWLSRNYGQHPATVAGIASSNADWIVTMDEDGQHDPAYIPMMLKAALENVSSLVYAKPSELAPHPWYRNATSGSAKVLYRLLTGQKTAFHSFRLVEGPPARAVCAYVGPNVYLDVALGWVLDNPSSVPVPMRAESMTESGYSVRSLLSHFWRMVLSSGTRPLRLIAVAGTLVATLGILFAVYLIAATVFGGGPGVAGWASVMVALLTVSGVLLVAIAMLAEYVGYSVSMALGRPLYLITDPPADRVLFKAVAAFRS